MPQAIEVKPDLFWIGSEDPELRTFDDLFPTEHGTTYNAYLIRGNAKTAIIDTVKAKRVDEYMDKVKSLTSLDKIDYIIVNHAEPDHSGSLGYLLEQCPEATVISTQAAKNFLANLLHKPFKSLVIKDGDTIDLGGRTLRFITAPFLHWPDTMFTRLEEENILFTCDAFGAHYCSPGKIFNDENEDITSARQFYFDCIFRPFKDKVLAAVEKIRHDVIDMICPSHGPIIRRDPWKVIQQFETWSKPVSHSKKTVILYLSPHGNTEKMAQAVAAGASLNGVEVISFHISHLSSNEIRNLMEDADALIFGIPTIVRDIPKPMWDVLAYLSTVKLKTNIAGLFGSYGWSGEACKMAEERLKSVGFKISEPIVKAPFKPTEEILVQCEALGKALSEEVLKKN
ncbi:FprA family A-type flavoprotein [Pelotalea chapellei]|uniref:FprA family A-type flavoprotein n=1 Tax=Pelotalea chapellei TaxID=44671 RepID=A0ABS5UAL8_9BACT|nr:FprA family A-type flavoprotein [Pelotalea chapellei]MBT1072704.1 FprA family A-type flavoprotein [Pelotalea chapellei]